MSYDPNDPMTEDDEALAHWHATDHAKRLQEQDDDFDDLADLESAPVADNVIPYRGSLSEMLGYERAETVEIMLSTTPSVDNAIAIAVLADEPDVYRTAEGLVQVYRAPHERPRWYSLDPYALQNLISKTVQYKRTVKSKEGGKPQVIDVEPPLARCRQILACREWDEVRPIVGIIDTPVLRKDGTVLSAPGYDPATRLLYEPSEEFPEVLERPTEEQVLDARDALFEMVEDFPFADATDRAAWLAALLTPFAREAIDGPVPMFMFEASTSRTGKSLLAEVTGIVSCGDRGMPVTPQWEDDAECAKSILAFARRGERVVCVDNCVEFGWPSLDMAVTSGRIDRRLLGTNETPSPDLRMVWYATSNNAILKADAIGRTLTVRLDAKMGNPEEREGFRKVELRGWVKEHRPRLAHAALTILRGWWAAGRPGVRKVKHFGGFEAWSNVIRSCVMWLGQADPNAVREKMLSDSNIIKETWTFLLANLYSVFPGTDFTAKKALEVAPGQTLEDALEAATGEDLAKLTTRSLGMCLYHAVGRIHGGYRLHRTAARGKEAAKYRVEQL